MFMLRLNVLSCYRRRINCSKAIDPDEIFSADPVSEYNRATINGCRTFRGGGGGEI